ncbi:MAG: hypothetical protein AAGC56_14810 [Pseudomonadota bacterium]
MKNRRSYDLVVFGAEPAGVAAAACAARAGAKVAYIETGHEPPVDGSASSVPNFVWRRLDLHEAGLNLETVSAHVSLLPEGRAVATFESDLTTQDALAKVDKADAGLWRDFRSELEHRYAAVEDVGADPLHMADGPRPHLMTDNQSTDTLVDLLEDYFDADDVRAHLAAVAALAFNLGGEEPGSALALAASAAQGAWRVRDGAALYKALVGVAERVGAERLDEPVVGVEQTPGRGYRILFTGDEAASTRALMASSTRLARAAGFNVDGAPSPLDVGDAAEARIRLKLEETPAPPTDAGGDAPVYYVAASPDEIRAARDAVLEGRTPDRPPLMFEIGDKEVRVRAPYCPRLLSSEEGPREWTGQDRQVLGAQVLERLGEHLNGALKSVRATDVEVFGAADLEKEAALGGDAPTVAAPPPALDEIGVAAALALRLVGEPPR